jgi:hypothetical protein
MFRTALDFIEQSVDENDYCFSITFELSPPQDLVALQTTGISPLLKDQFTNEVFLKVYLFITKVQNGVNQQLIPSLPSKVTSLMKIMRTEIEYSAKTFTELIENVYGYFCFWCNQNTDESQFPHFDKEPEKGVVNAITYIAPEALSLLNSLDFNCIVLDGTLKLIPAFVISIVSGIKFNTYFPLGYTI